MTPVPDLAGFEDAMERKRQALGVNVTFFSDPVYVYPSGTQVSPESGEPFDPTVDPVSSAMASAVVKCGLFFKAVNRGGGASEAVDAPIGIGEREDVFVIAPSAAASAVSSATSFAVHNDRFKVISLKRDMPIGHVERLLLYGRIEK